MEEAEARAYLELLLSPMMEPLIFEEDLDLLMLRARTVDANGVYPTEPNYVPTWTTWSIESVASTGWELRASRCVGDIDFAEDGQRFNMSQRFDQCMIMAKLYRRGVSGGGSGYVRVPSIVTNP